jgi:aminoglycoside phosphotransferase (APT) family kinase protein
MSEDVTAANSGTDPVREGYGFDEAALAAWMAANVEDYAGPLHVRQFKGGQSNPTYQLVTPTRKYVLRRKPPGELLPGAHAVDREALVLSKLGAAGFPVAKVYGLCTDDAVIGTWFFVMEMVEGRIFWDATFPDVPREDRPRYFDAMNGTLAQLHSYDPQAIGLGEYGKPGRANTSPTSLPAATPTWTRWSNGCQRWCLRRKKAPSSTAISAATT